MSVKATLTAGLDALPAGTTVEDARSWLTRTEILLEWIAQHPKFVEIQSEGARLLLAYRGTDRPSEES